MKTYHDISHALALLTDQVLHRDLDVVQFDICGARGNLTLYLQPPHCHARIALERAHDHTEALCARPTRPHGHGCIVGPEAVGDPLFLAVEDVVFAVGRLLSHRGNVGHITARAGLRDGDTRAFLAGEQVREELFVECFVAKLDDGWDAKGVAGRHAATRACDTDS